MKAVSRLRVVRFGLVFVSLSSCLCYALMFIVTQVRTNSNPSVLRHRLTSRQGSVDLSIGKTIHNKRQNNGVDFEFRNEVVFIDRMERNLFLDMNITETRNNDISNGVGYEHSEAMTSMDASCPALPSMTVSLSSPPHYPDKGTGTRIELGNKFNTSIFDSTCKRVPSLAAIVTVYSAVENYDRRTAIRKTIGQSCKRANCRIIFIMACSENEELMQNLMLEYKTFNDILIVGRLDSYRHLNDKAVAMLDWILEHCSKARHVIHFVDDTYANVELFIKELDVYQARNAVYGNVDRGIPPVRVKRDKYYVSSEEYPYQLYPDFAIGAAYSFPNNLTKKLRCALHSAIYIWLEDVWLMGHVRIRAGIDVIHTTQMVEPYQGQINFQVVDKYLFIHSIHVQDFYKIHERMEQIRAGNA